MQTVKLKNISTSRERGRVDPLWRVKKLWAKKTAGVEKFHSSVQEALSEMDLWLHQ